MYCLGPPETFLNSPWYGPGCGPRLVALSTAPLVVTFGILVAFGGDFCLGEDVPGGGASQSHKVSRGRERQREWRLSLWLGPTLLAIGGVLGGSSVPAGVPKWGVQRRHRCLIAQSGPDVPKFMEAACVARAAVDQWGAVSGLQMRRMLPATELKGRERGSSYLCAFSLKPTVQSASVQAVFPSALRRWSAPNGSRQARQDIEKGPASQLRRAPSRPSATPTKSKLLDTE